MKRIIQLGKDEVSFLDPPNEGLLRDKSGRDWRIGRTGNGNIMLRSAESHPDFLPDGMDLQSFCQWINSQL